MTKKKSGFIPQDEQRIAAYTFTLSNLAMEDYIGRCGGDIIRAYHKASEDLAMECGCGAEEELADWTDMVAEPGMLEQWEAKKAELLAQYPDLKFE